MSSHAAMGTCPPRSGMAMRGLLGDVKGASAHAAAPGNLAPERKRVPDSVTDVNFIRYEDHGFAERFGGYQLDEAEVTSVRGALLVNPSERSKAEGRPFGAVGVAQCPESFAQCRVVVNQIDAARIAMAHNIIGLTALSAGTILEGPTANGS
jgi:acetyl-CoA C-acetyltransferase